MTQKKGRSGHIGDFEVERAHVELSKDNQSLKRPEGPA